jgi:hypothetical protein
MAVYACNDSGAAKGPLTQDYLYRNLIQTHDDEGNDLMHDGAIPHLKPSEGDRAVVIFDGCKTHVSYDLFQWAKENHITIMLRPPHTSHLIQSADLHSFKIFKASYRKRCGLVLNEKIQCKQGTPYEGKLASACMTLSDVPYTACTPCSEAFSKVNNLKAMEMAGIIPFTRRPQHFLAEKEETNKETLQATHVATGINFSHVLAAIAGVSGKPKDDAESDADDEEDADDEDETLGTQRLGKGSNFWAKGSETIAALRENHEKKKAAEAEKVERANKRLERAEQNKSEALALIDELKVCVLVNGTWKMKDEEGKRTKILKKHLDAVFTYFNTKPPESLEEWVPIIKKKLCWDEDQKSFSKPPQVREAAMACFII